MKGFRADGPCLVLANVKNPVLVRVLVQDAHTALMRSFAPSPELASALLNLALIHCLVHTAAADEVVAGVDTWFREHGKGGN